MYDVKNGGKKKMTKRLTMTLVALAVFVLFAVLPVSASMLATGNPATGRFNGSVITSQPSIATVFIGESGLNITPVISAPLGTGVGGVSYIPLGTKIGWWAPGSQPGNPPSQVIDVSSQYTNFYVDPNVFGQYTGVWYCLTANNVQNGSAFIVADPSQVIAAIDIGANQGTGQDMTGGSVVRGTILTFKLSTNLAAFTAGGRINNFTASGGTYSWDNGTFNTHVTSGSNLQTTAVANDVFYWSFSNVTPIAMNQISAGNVVTFTNYSRNTGNVNGNATFTRTMFYNATTYSANPGETSWHGQNLTTTAAGTTNLAAVPSDVGTGIWNNALDPTADGFMMIKLKDTNGQVQSTVFVNNFTMLLAPTTTASMSYQWVNQQPWYFPGGATAFAGANGQTTAVGWNTGANDPATGGSMYPAGTYTIWTTTTLSHIADNYLLNGAAYTGKAVSAAGTVTLVSDTVKIEANKDTVVRSNPFSVTITGKPLTTYVIWLKGTSSMDGTYDNQPPLIGLYQDKVYMDSQNLNNATYAALGIPFRPIIGNYSFQNAANGASVYTDVAQDDPSLIWNSTRYYALINLSAAGTRTVQFETTNWTKAQQYTIRVSRDSSWAGGAPSVNTPTLRQYKEDEVSVNVVKGAVTITAAGDQSYYLGEDVKFSGTDTESQNVYIFLTGPNLWPQGSRIDLQDPRRFSTMASQVMDNDATTFHVTPVNGDNTWSWTWGTSNYALDAGTYTIYAVSGPRDSQHLDNVAYGTVSIIVKKPFVSATASQSVVAQGDSLWVTGTAEGKPQPGVQIWIMGKNYAQVTTESVASDASFSHEITKAQTTSMDAGQYFIVVQHPMQNQVFDINLITSGIDIGWVVNYALRPQGTAANAGQGYTKIFQLLGPSSLQGTDAANALAQAINDPNVDDTYTKLQYLVEVPVIRIDPVGDRHVGDKFSITATTNLAVDDDVLFQVYSSSFKPTEKTQSGEFSGASGTVKVTAGNTGLNKLSFDVDASTFKPDEYIVQADRVLQPKATATALFNVLEGAAPTAVPTAVGPTAAATTAAVATTMPPTTVQPTPTKTPTQPGFGALVALIGLGAVAFLVVRRH
jgi:PGF-CTERM protein